MKGLASGTGRKKHKAHRSHESESLQLPVVALAVCGRVNPGHRAALLVTGQNGGHFREVTVTGLKWWSRVSRGEAQVASPSLRGNEPGRAGRLTPPKGERDGAEL
ncbi:hypothetical protein AAFF_G00248870 [Aldrovandia affinis]|uniref:Uncharacterized protein n=1 Tax=Aldrovandia affinis TaxID=143900 RepID=A0AAD7RCZ6_9TELE|nr:hypothetical protein AAFF_G00248870 [Aldrovandia affinis]